MPLFVNKISISSTSMLSRKAGIIIGRISGASYWLASLIFAKKNSLFASEQELITHALSGLHATDLFYLAAAQLWIAPERLLAIETEDLVTLFGPVNDDKQTMSLILKKYSLINHTSLALVYEFLENHNLHQHPLFSCMDAGEKNCAIAIINKINFVNEEKSILPPIYAALAITWATSATDFFNYCLFLMYYNKKMPDNSNESQHNYSVIQSFYDNFSKSIINYLYPPQAPNPLTQSELSTLLSRWLGQGNFIGFATMSSAMAIVAEQINSFDLAEPDITSCVFMTMQKLNTFFLQYQATDASLNQLGDAWIYYYDYAEATASLRLSTKGLLTLDSFKIH